jgi:hypothetical protein
VKTARRPVRDRHPSGEAEQLATAIHALGNYSHVTVDAQRGLLYVLADEEPVARLTPLGAGRYGLSFHQHTGRWEQTPFSGDLAHLAGVLVTEFGAYLASWDFPSTKNGSAH